MKNDLHMLEAARAGYDGEPNSHLFSSSMWMAHQVGAAAAAYKMSRPARCSQSRGFSVNVACASGAKFRAKFNSDLSVIAWDAA